LPICHLLVLDGVYRREGEDRLQFVSVQAPSTEELSGFSSTSAVMPGPSIRRIRAERRRRAIAWSDRFVLFVTTPAAARERAGVGLRRDAPAFPGERGRFTRLNH
jgi:hypothetical protein